MVLITGKLKELKRCRVRVVSVERRRYLVDSGRGFHAVQLAVSESGRPLGACPCEAGRRGRECSHLVAAAVVASGIRRARLAQERGAA